MHLYFLVIGDWIFLFHFSFKVVVIFLALIYGGKNGITGKKYFQFFHNLLEWAVIIGTISVYFDSILRISDVEVRETKMMGNYPTIIFAICIMVFFELDSKHVWHISCGNKLWYSLSSSWCRTKLRNLLTCACRGLRVGIH